MVVDASGFGPIRIIHCRKIDPSFLKLLVDMSGLSGSSYLGMV